MKLFISWAKDSAKEMALFLHQWIPSITSGHISTWCSPDPRCLPHGSGFPQTILSESKQCDACLIILTRDNLSSWWVNFEAGLFFGQEKKVYGILCGDLSYRMLGGENHPLSAHGVNYTNISIDSLSDFLISLKNGYKDWDKHENDSHTLVKERFPELQKKYTSIFTDDYIQLSKLLAEDIDLIK